MPICQEKTKEERSAALIPRIKDAMALGLQVLDEAFEKIDVNEANSESEDEDAAYVTEAILEPKVMSHVDISTNWHSHRFLLIF